MKVMTILGTRPEIIRLSGVIHLLDQYCDHVLVHTGQNYDDRLSRIFFEELEVRQPNEYMEVRSASFGAQIGQILAKSEELFMKHRPDRLLILGDTNSGTAAIVAKRLGIAVYHMEAGNRCYDDRVPEEVNRRVIDHSSTILLPYTHNSKENLLREGIANHRIFVTGNPIKQVIDHFEEKIADSQVLAHMKLEAQRYFLVTIHRAENVDRQDRLQSIVESLTDLYREYDYPIVCSLHPRTRSKIERFGINIDQAGLQFVEPLGFLDFAHLEQQAFCLLSDSGTVQEEGCIFGVPNITLRDVTERPETVECGSNILSGVASADILQSVHIVMRQTRGWKPPREYVAPFVAETVVRILNSYRVLDPSEIEWQIGCRL